MTQQPNVPAAVRARLSLEYPQSLGVYEQYEQAQRAVDYLSDHEFPVQHVLIVGTELKQLERVTGRLTTSKVLLGGAMSGAWLGFFVGLIFAMFEPGGFVLANLIGTVLFGTLFGVIWAAIGYRMAKGERDFTSVSQVVATRYEVLVEHRYVQQARDLLAQMDPYAAAEQQIRRAQEEAVARAEAERADGQVDPPTA